MRLKYFFIGLCLTLTINSMGQNGSVSITPIYDASAQAREQVMDNFCSTLTQLINDASNDFVRAKGKEVETNAETAIWTTNIGLPGVVTSSLLFTTSWQYEGVIYQGSSFEDILVYYEKYKKLLEGCLPAKGYFRSGQANPDAKLDNYPELIYAIPTVEGKLPTPAITMKADHAENTGTYTLSVNVWQAKK